MSASDTSASGWVAAVDLGATSGRVMLGHVGPDELSVEVVHRFPNQPVRTAAGLGWNVLELYRNVLEGLRRAVAVRPDVASIGVDSWAVDYALLRGDRMISSPLHYRDERTARGVRAVHDVVGQADLYAASGVAFLPFNTLYQLTVDRADELLDASTTMLMVPDLFGFWLTGRSVAERTNASTTGLLDLGGGWNTALIGKLGLPRSLFAPLVDPGTRVGSLRASVAAELGTGQRIDVVAVGSHDTASAVVATPMRSRRAAYISSGTWSLVGVELDRPVVTEAGRAANFTNEGGVDGRIRYLHNVMGMWLLSESVRGWQRDGATIDLPELLRAAAHVREPVAIFDANDPSLLPEGDMPTRIAALCARNRLPVPGTPAEFTRSILESLAAAYAVAIDRAQELSGTTIEVVHVVGGGSQNALLCQLTADRTGRPVLAGPVEATAVGNVLVQARSAGLVSGDLEQLRGLVARFFPPTRFDPDPRPDAKSPPPRMG